MLLTHELVLLSRKTDGGPLIHDLVLDRVLAGALLADLRAAGKIAVSAEGAVTVLDTTPTGTEVLDSALGPIAGIAPTDVKTAVKNLDDHLGTRTRTDLTGAGVLHEQSHKTLGLINNTQWAPGDPAQHADLIAHVRACFPDCDGGDEHDRALVAFLAASGALDELIDKAAAAEVADTALADADPIAAVVRRMVRKRRFAAAAGASAGGTTGGISS